MREEPREGILVATEVAREEVELEKVVEKAPPKNIDRPSGEEEMERTGPFNPTKGRGDQVEEFVVQAATFPPYVADVPPTGDANAPPAYTVVLLHANAST